MPPAPQTRRHFIAVSLVGLGGARLLLGCGDATNPFQFFSAEEARLVECISEQIIPADDTPGARDAGVVHFIDRQLVGPYKRHQPDYRNGLAAFQNTCRGLYGKSFEEMEWQYQTGVLERFERGEITGHGWEQQRPASFFNLLRDHSMQGFYGDPRHGGNRDWASYRMLGIQVLDFSTPDQS